MLNFLKNFQISFSLIIEGNKVFSPLRYENDLLKAYFNVNCNYYDDKRHKN